MNFDINETLAEMANAIKGVVKKDWPQVKNTVNKFLQNKKERLLLIAELRLSGDLTEEKMKLRLEDEKLVAEAELHAIAVVSKAMAQKAANAAIEILEKAIVTAVKAAL